MHAEEAAALPPPEFHRTPVLYLEDNEEAAAAFESSLRSTEFQPILARTIAQAEAWALRHIPAAVVADVYIGDDLAWEFVDQLQARLPHVPVLVTSASDEREMAVAHGAQAFLPKPLERETLLGELRRLTLGGGMRKLLLVDDNEVSRYILRELLSQPWLQIQEASNGREALERLEEGLPDGIILDLLMPDLSGFDILRELRGRVETLGLPVLIYTSKPLTESERAQLEEWNAATVRKEDVSTRLSAQPFLEWIKSNGLIPDTSVREQHA